MFPIYFYYIILNLYKLYIILSVYLYVSNIFPVMLTVIQQAGTSKARAPVALGTPGSSTAVLQQAEIP